MHIYRKAHHSMIKIRSEESKCHYLKHSCVGVDEISHQNKQSWLNLSEPLLLCSPKMNVVEVFRVINVHHELTCMRFNFLIFLWAADKSLIYNHMPKFHQPDSSFGIICFITSLCTRSSWWCSKIFGTLFIKNWMNSLFDPFISLYMECFVFEDLGAPVYIEIYIYLRKALIQCCSIEAPKVATWKYNAYGEI